MGMGDMRESGDASAAASRSASAAFQARWFPMVVRIIRSYGTLKRIVDRVPRPNRGHLGQRSASSRSSPCSARRSSVGSRRWPARAVRAQEGRLPQG